MSVSQPQPSALPVIRSERFSLPASNTAPEERSPRISLKARFVGCGRRLRRSLLHGDACDMTPERAFLYNEAFARITNHVDMEDSSARQAALKACIPLLYNMRVPSVRAQYLRRMAYLAPAYAGTPGQFMQQMLPHIDAYGQGLSSGEVLQVAGF